MLTQSFDAHPTVFMVVVVTKARGIIRRVDSIYSTLEGATKRQRAMFLEPDELAQVHCKAVWSVDEKKGS